MPTSFHDALDVVLPFVIGLDPARVLDVGIGFGKYGFLFREYLDVARRGDGGGRPRVTVDGIEAHAPYVTRLQREIYDEIHVGDALTVLPALDPYDLVFAADVLEHFRPADGRSFLDACAARATLGTLVVTPVRHLPQGPRFGNDYERHRSHWTAGDFARHRGADVLLRRRQLVVWLPATGVAARLPRVGIREALGLAARTALTRVIGPTRAGALLDRRHR
jgi:hypothetical protein